MEYNMRQIGEKIASLRKAEGLSQEQMVEALSVLNVKIGRNRLSEIENGKRNDIDFSFLEGCSKLFDCDIGYLLCEYEDCRTADWQAINNVTGLSEKSIEVLSLRKCNAEGIQSLKILNWFLTDPRFFGVLLYRASKYLAKSINYDEISKRYHQEGRKRQIRSQGDLAEEIRLQIECQDLVTRKDVNNAEAAKDAAYLQLLKAFILVIDSLEYNYKKGNIDDMRKL